MLDQRSSFDQQYVPYYNNLALKTLTFPALHPDSMPELSPFAGYDINGQVAQHARMWRKNEFGQYGASGLAPRSKMRFVTRQPRPYTIQPSPRPYTHHPALGGARRWGANPSYRENYGGSKLKDLKVDMYYSTGCGWCKKSQAMLKKAGELKNVTLKDVSKPENSAEMKAKNIGGQGVPAFYANATRKNSIGHSKSVEALVAKLS